jgi:small subunit ribosomal protein S21
VSDRFKGIEIRPRPNEEPDRFIKRFLRKVRNEGIIQEVFLRRAFEKPSVKRRRKQSRARFLARIAERP